MGKKEKFTLSFLPSAHYGFRRQYWGILKSPKCEWNTREAARRSRAYQQLQKAGREPRVRKQRLR